MTGAGLFNELIEALNTYGGLRAFLWSNGVMQDLGTLGGLAVLQLALMTLAR